MKLAEAMLSLKPFKRPHSLNHVQYFMPGTGPHKSLVSCDYFVFHYDGSSEGEFSTSIDLYPEDITADDYVLLEAQDGAETSK